MAYEKQNFTDGQVLKAEHLNKIEDELAREKSWADIGKTTVQGDTLTWDGNTEGRVVVDVCGDGSYLYVKLSDFTPTAAELVDNAQLTADMGAGVYTDLIISDHIFDDGSDSGIVNIVEVMLVVSKTATNVETDYGIFPEAGTYFGKMGEMRAYSLIIPGYTGFTKTEIKTIDPEYLPKALQFGESETVILEEQELTVAGGMCTAAITATLQEGDKITVEYDGAGYDCEAFTANGAICFGNGALCGLENNTGEPFAATASGGVLYIIPEDAEATSHTVKISLVEVEKIDPQYYSGQTVFYHSGGDVYLYADKELTTKVTANALKKAATNGNITVLYYASGSLEQVSYVGAVSFNGNYGAVCCINMTGAVNKAYTAEYTAE